MTAVPRWSLEAEAPAAALRGQGFVIVPPAQLGRLASCPVASFDAWLPLWDALPPDQHLRDGGSYRFRRHSCFVHAVASDDIAQVPHRAHWQPTAYNALHGGIERWFEPIDAELTASPAWHRLLCGLGTEFARVEAAERWYIEAHQFRIDTASGVGRPTPEGAHRDGVDFVAVILVDRHHVRGGETRVFEADGPHGIRFVLERAWTAILLDDARVIHETTPIQPDAVGGHRDTLVLTYRRDGFQAP
ncbi:MAG: 2OG-Fe dioxygenase family protein [Betaproteobacteria bacterium]